MVHRIAGAGPPYEVSNIGDGISGTSEVGGAVNIPHWKGEVKYDEGLYVGRMWEGNKGKSGDVLLTDPDTHVCVVKVVLGKEDLAKGGVKLDDMTKEAR